MNNSDELRRYLTGDPTSFINNIDRLIQIIDQLYERDGNYDYVVNDIINEFRENFDPHSEFIQDMFRKVLRRMKLIGFPIITFSIVHDDDFTESPLYDVLLSELSPYNTYNEEKVYTSRHVGDPSYIIGQYTGSIIPDLSYIRFNKGNPKYEELIDYITPMPPIRYNSPPLSSDSYRSSPRDTRRSPVRNFGKPRVRSLSPRRNRKIDRNKKTRGRSPMKNLNKRRHRSRSPRK